MSTLPGALVKGAQNSLVLQTAHVLRIRSTAHSRETALRCKRHIRSATSLSELQLVSLEIFLSVFGIGPPQSIPKYYDLFLSRVINVSQRPMGRPVFTGQKRFGAPHL